MKKRLVILSLACAAACAFAADYPIHPANLTDVRVTGGFWLPRFETNRLVTLRTCLDKCNETPRIANFTNAANRAWGTFRGIPFDDSDVYKIMEGAAYILAQHPDPKLEKYVDWLIGQMARAQEPDGYLYTARTLGFNYGMKDGKVQFGMMGPTRWSGLGGSHELYNVGHMYEAAVAWQAATGRRNFLDVAIRSADLVDRVFGEGPTQLKSAPGHEEIELALVKLYRATGETRYLNLARHFIERRGVRANAVQTAPGSFKDEVAMPGANVQQHLPVRLQTRAIGHAVRAGYLYCGMADVAALTGDPAYLDVIGRIWENVVSKKLHLSGGVGARRKGEAFGDDYELPNETAYLETCAAIGNALWNQRLFLTYGEAKYVDVLERILYNGFLSGVSLGGDEFFYPNPLASYGNSRRSKWFSCSCCPGNIVRFMPQIAQFAYATRGETAYVNLFLASTAKLPLADGALELEQATEYPWQGASRLTVKPPRDGARFTLAVRVPGWCTGRPVPSDLYTQTVPGRAEDFAVKVNGAVCAGRREKGYCLIERAWRAGDTVDVAMAMPVRRVKAHPAVAADVGRLAVERGPVLYCAEGVDNDGRVLDAVIPADATFADATRTIAGQTFPALVTEGARAWCGLAKRAAVPATLTLVPYFAWCHRGAGEMQTWFPVSAEAAPATLYRTSASHCGPTDSLRSLCEGNSPASSSDMRLPRHTFWPHKGTEEWVQYDLPAAETLTGVDVYWFDDIEKKGGCALPEAWRVECRADAAQPWTVAAANGPVRKDGFCSVTFPAPVQARQIRLVIQLRPKRSGGLLAWRLR